MNQINIQLNNPAPGLNVLDNNINERDLLIDNYLPNLSNYQKVIKKIVVNDQNNNKKEETFILSPNVNFFKEKDYFIFYNDNLKTLKKLYEIELKEYLKKHDFVLYCKYSNIQKALKKLEYSCAPDNSYSPGKLISYFIGYNWYKDIIEHADLLGSNLNILTSTLNQFSDMINPNNFCAIRISENLFDEPIRPILYSQNSKENKSLDYYREIEELKEQNITNEEKLNLMNQKIDELKQRIMPENSINKLIDFCFVLNKISEYLSNFERSLETKELSFLKIMNTLRTKLDFYLLEYRYKFVENQEPILNIKIGRYKILCDSQETTGIYLEKGEMKKFMKSLREEIEIKARNIDQQHQFQDIDIDIIINIAREIKFNSYKDLIEGFEAKIKREKEKKESIKQELIYCAVQQGLKVAISAAGMSVNVSGIMENIPLDQMKNIITSDKAIKDVNEEKEENTTENGETNGKNDIKEDKPGKLLEERRKNLESIGIDAKNMNNEKIDKVIDSFKKYNEMNKIEDNISDLEKMKTKIEQRYEYNYDFFNGVKLYCEIEKKNIQNDDYVGIILEEKNKHLDNDLREYSAKKLSCI